MTVLSPRGLHLSLPIFSGPLEDLFSLIDDGLISPADIPMKEVVMQCLAYSFGDMAEEAALVALCSRLVRAKAQALLEPTSGSKDSLLVGSAETEARAELRQVAEQAVELFQQLVQRGRRSYRRRQPALLREPRAEVQPVPLEGLAAMARGRLAELMEKPDPGNFQVPTLQECMERVREILRHTPRVAFSGLMAQCKDRLEVILTFLAVLELMRQGFVQAHQEQPFGEIWIETC